jgi:hypothetical protein
LQALRKLGHSVGELGLGFGTNPYYVVKVLSVLVGVFNRKLGFPHATATMNDTRSLANSLIVCHLTEVLVKQR